MHMLDQWQATDARTDIAADTRRHLIAKRLARRQAAVSNRLARCSQPQVNEAVHIPGFFFGNVIRDIETLDLTCKFTGKVAHIKMRNQVNARRSGKHADPGIGHGIAYRADTTQTGHNDTTMVHSCLLYTSPSP